MNPRKNQTQQVQELTALYRSMSLIRHVETALTRLFANGEVPGFIHQSNGQEGVAAGVASAMHHVQRLHMLIEHGTPHARYIVQQTPQALIPVGGLSRAVRARYFILLARCLFRQRSTTCHIHPACH